MSNPDLQKPFPDYVTCQHCAEPEVEVWCYATLAQCHACGRTFAHALPPECRDHCDRVQYPADHPSLTHLHPSERSNHAC